MLFLRHILLALTFSIDRYMHPHTPRTLSVSLIHAVVLDLLLSIATGSTTAPIILNYNRLNAKRFRSDEHNGERKTKKKEMFFIKPTKSHSLRR
ncbi:Uncharacterized protein APZ42_005209 [Daphnia magna]|uniref:Uncharacterized protein n=1 Tax=Daphnia magna TaxID=35525 RepID=A0A164GL30_9CRUS|nr:Uncharacterized protein APZ42_005209 [Daphnia magna]